MPAPTKWKNLKADTSTCWGVFLGYRLAPGDVWTGQYLVGALDELVGMPLDKDADERECFLTPHVTDSVSISLALVIRTVFAFLLNVSMKKSTSRLRTGKK
jgi:hypothetical protein